MPLLDHFRPPLAPARHWEGFHAAWAVGIANLLNRRLLPDGYFAEAQVHIGGLVEVDVPTFERGGGAAPADGDSGTVAVETWAPPATALTIPFVFPDEVEVQVFRESGGATLVAAVELISPGNKDRPETRRAFASKCASCLHAGVGLVVIDVVTTLRANLHDELMQLLGRGEETRFPAGPSLYAVAYRPARTDPGGDRVTLWPFPLAVGEALPVVPLALRGGPTLPVNLEECYAETRLGYRL
jgi:hypothetical protein